MPEAVMEATYCAQQIVIPPTFPHILKVFAKAAIRTQPYDLLTWASAYFKALSDGTMPPEKERLEYPLIRSEGGLSYGYLKLLVKQFDTPDEIERRILTKRWLGICLCETELKQIYCTGNLYTARSFPLFKFIAVAAGFLCNSLTQTMVMLCEIYTDEPDGSSSSIQASFFIEMYKYLSKIDASEEITYYDGLTKEEYKSKLRRDSTIEEGTKEEPCIERWIPKLRGWKTETSVLKKNTLLGAELPTEGGQVSENILLSILPPRERYTDPRHPHFPYISPEALECPFTKEEVESEQSVHPSQEQSEGVCSKEECSQEGEKQEGEEEQTSENAEQKEEDEEKANEDEEETGSPEKDGEEREDQEEAASNEEDDDDSREGEDSKEEGEGDESGEKEEQDEEGSKVLVRVYSEEGKKIRSTSLVAPGEEDNEDISVREREAIIEQLEQNKEKRVSEFMEAIESLDDLVEKTKQLKSEADKMGSKGELVVCSTSIMSSTSKILSPEVSKEKSVTESDSSKIAREHIAEVIVVPPKPGIGCAMDPASVQEVIKFIEETSSYQEGMIMPRDIVHCLAPSLEVKCKKEPRICRCMADDCHCDEIIAEAKKEEEEEKKS